MRSALRMVAIESRTRSSSPIDVGIIDVAAYVAVLGISAVLLQHGGAVAIAAAAIGAGLGFCRKDRLTWREKARAAWDSSVAALWVGLMIGGILAS
jgi:hypothetical protein